MVNIKQWESVTFVGAIIFAHLGAWSQQAFSPGPSRKRTSAIAKCLPCKPMIWPAHTICTPNPPKTRYITADNRRQMTQSKVHHQNVLRFSSTSTDPTEGKKRRTQITKATWLSHSSHTTVVVAGSLRTGCRSIRLQPLTKPTPSRRVQQPQGPAQWTCRDKASEDV